MGKFAREHRCSGFASTSFVGFEGKSVGFHLALPIENTRKADCLGQTFDAFEKGWKTRSNNSDLAQFSMRILFPKTNGSEGSDFELRFDVLARSRGGSAYEG